MSGEEREKIKAWVDNWKVTGEELDRLKWEELREMDPALAVLRATQAFAAADGWRAMQPSVIDRPSGMIDQQFWFAKWPKKLI